MREKNENKIQQNSVKKVAICGLFVALAMIFSYVESLLPIPFPFPGMRLGFANIAVISILYTYGERDAFSVNLIRIILMAMIFGNLHSFLFSISGGLSSLVVMTILRKIPKFSIIGVSLAGGVTHNIVQIILAIFILGSVSIGYLLPIFMILGIVTGIICGIVAKIFIRHIQRAKD